MRYAATGFLILTLAVGVLLVASCGGGDEDEDPGGDDDNDDGEPVFVTREFLENGEFDGGRAAPWVQRSAGNYPVISGPAMLPVRAHTGGFAAWFGGYEGARDSLWQPGVLPETSMSLKLSFALYIYSEHQRESLAVDTLSVDLRDGLDNEMHSFATFSNRDANDSWEMYEYELTDLSAWRDQEIRLHFLGETDDVAITDFFVDTVSLQVTYTVSDPE